MFERIKLLFAIVTGVASISALAYVVHIPTALGGH